MKPLAWLGNFIERGLSSVGLAEVGVSWESTAELRDGMAFGDTIRPEALHGHFNTQKDLHHHQNDPHDPPDQTDTQSPSPPEESPSHLRSRQDDLSGSARDAIPSMVGRTTRRRARAAAAQDKENI